MPLAPILKDSPMVCWRALLAKGGDTTEFAAAATRTRRKPMFAFSTRRTYLDLLLKLLKLNWVRSLDVLLEVVEACHVPLD